MEKYKVIDLFAGAGGLSLGFTQTNRFDIKVAFENSPYMQETYRFNHPGTEVRGDVCVADYQQIMKEYGKIDVVIGGPPCQGFSNANRQKNHAINQNNMLVKQYIRAIIELQPSAFVMENVSMLRSDVHRFYMETSDEEIVNNCSIPVQETKLQLLDKEFIFDGATDIIKNIDQINNYLWPDSHYYELNVIYKLSKNISKMEQGLVKHKPMLDKIIPTYLDENLDINLYINLETRNAFKSISDYYAGKLPITDLVELIKPSIMIQRMLSKAKEIFDNNIIVDSYTVDEDGISANIRSFAVFDYLKGILGNENNNYIITSDILNAADFGAPQKRKRFVLMGVKKNVSSTISLPEGTFTPENYRTVKDAIKDIEDIETVFSLEDDKDGKPVCQKNNISDLALSLRNSPVLKNHIVTSTTKTAMERFKALGQGENFHSLNDSLKTNTYTDISRTQNTIYLRLDYNKPSGTVLNVRKSMWIHPTIDRALSIREAARLQTFPDSFVFCGTKDKQYQQVGNAVPPILANAIANKIINILDSKI